MNQFATHAIWIAIGAFGVFSCVDLYAAPPAGSSDSNTVNVKDYGAVGNGATDDTAAIQKAVNAAPPNGSGVLNVFIPAGTYKISSAIPIHSNIRIFGSGSSSVVYQATANTNEFELNTQSPMAQNVAVDHLCFKGVPSGFHKAYGLYVSFITNVTFANNCATSIPLINVTAPETSSESQLSSKLLISDNTASGIPGQGAAINLTYVSDGTINNNTIDGYDDGIQFWGGDAAHGPALLTKRLTIRSNVVRNVTAAIWGSGQNIKIEGNAAENCKDVCLDVEGSADVSISSNTVKNAVNGGIATFFGSQRVTISSNTVAQDSSHGAGIYFHGSGASSDITVSENKINVAGAGPGINTDQGALANSKIQSNQIVSSTAAPAIRILEGGHVDIVGNKLFVAGATGISYEGPSSGSIVNNTLTDTLPSQAADTSKGGILLYWRSSSEPTQHNRIAGNTIVDFPISINDCNWGDNSSFNIIEENSADSIYHHGSGPAYQGSIRKNFSHSNPGVAVVGTVY